MALSVVYSVAVPLSEALEVSGKFEQCLRIPLHNKPRLIFEIVSNINAGTGYFFLLCGWGLLFWQPFALQYGKRLTYIVSLIAICVSLIA